MVIRRGDRPLIDVLIFSSSAPPINQRRKEEMHGGSPVPQQAHSKEVESVH